MPDQDLNVLGFDLSAIRNSNERRVVRLMPEVLALYPEFEPDQLDVEDIYALTLNRLAPRYRQRGTIQISGRLSDDEIADEISAAVQTVRENPTDGRDR